MSNIEIIHELWRRHDLDFLRHEGQIQINKVIDQTNIQSQVVLCARQLGKTYNLVSYAIEFCLKNPKAVVKYGAAFQTDLEEFVQPAFDKILANCPEDIRPTYLKSKKKWIFQNGATIQLIGCDKNPNKLRGNKLDLIILDEAAFVNRLKYIFDSVIMPATTHSPECKIIMASTPPESMDHDFIGFIQEAKKNGTITIFTIDDNPLIDEANKKRLIDAAGGPNSITARREYYCELIIDETKAVIPEFKKELHVKEIETPKTFQFLHKFTSMDNSGGKQDKQAILTAYYDFPRSKVCVLSEALIDAHEVTTKNVGDKVKELEKQSFQNHEVTKRIADSDNVLFLRQLQKDEKISFIPTTKQDKHTMVNNLRMLFLENRIEISPECKLLILTLESALWDNKRKTFTRSKALGHMDLLDALIYLIENIHFHINPIPRNYGLSGNYYLPPEQDHQNDAKNVMKEIFNVKNKKR